MKKIFLIFASAFFFGTVFAQTTLSQVSESLSKNKITRGDFTMTRSMNTRDDGTTRNRALTSSGKFTIAADYGIIWFTEKPVKTIQCVTNSFMVTENARGRRTKINGAENKIYTQMASLISALFCNNITAAEQNAGINFTAKDGQWSAELFPKDASVRKMIEKITVSGSTKNGNFVASEIIMVSAGRVDVTSYLLSNHKFFDKLTDDEISLFKE